MMLGGQRSDVSRTPCSLQGSHVDSPKVVKVVAVSVAVLAVVVVVVEARRVASQRLLLLGSDVVRNKTEETTESVSSKCWRLDSLKLINEIIKGGDAYFNPPIQKQDTVLVADLHVCTSFLPVCREFLGHFSAIMRLILVVSAGTLWCAWTPYWYHTIPRYLESLTVSLTLTQMLRWSHVSLKSR